MAQLHWGTGERWPSYTGGQGRDGPATLRTGERGPSYTEGQGRDGPATLRDRGEMAQLH